MCGIVGIIYKDPTRIIEPIILKKATSTLIHRGPDDEGYYIDGNVGLGMRRLAIIDIKGGHQPIANETNELVIIYNGELYNYLPLREELIKKGHKFCTKSDTESILHAYEEYGLKLFPQLNGMFAFAIWDSKQKSLFLARDRLGIKPLFYYEDEEKFIFASEIKAILAFPNIQANIDNYALFDYFTYNYIPAPKTIFKEIKKLPPAHYLLWKNNSYIILRYWDFSYHENFDLNLGSAIEKLEELLVDSIKIRLMSEVPLGAFLSGGIDSSTIAYYIVNKNLKADLHTFSIGFETRSRFNELPFSSLVAQKLNTIHHTMIVAPQMINLLPKVIYFLDEPMSDSSNIPTYLLSQYTRQFVTVALSGDGGDELFAGYERQLILNILNYFFSLPKALQEFLINKVFAKFPSMEQKDSHWESLKRLLNDIMQGNLATYRRWVTNCNASILKQILTPDLFKQYSDYAVYQIIDECFSSITNPINQSLNFETRYYLPDDLLLKIDRMSMAHSLEVRVPFLDYRLVEFAAQLPVRYKINGRKTKFILKELMQRYLPREVIHKPKQGFTPPIKEWLKKDLYEFTHDYLLGSNIPPQLNKAGIKELLLQHYSGKRSFQYQIWSLLIYTIWYHSYNKTP